MSNFLKQRLEATEAQIVEIEDAISAVVGGGVQSYSLNTSQTQQSVTRANLKSWQDVLDQLYNRRATLRARIYGEGVTNMRGAW